MSTAAKRSKRKKRHLLGAQAPQLVFQFVIKWGTSGNDHVEFDDPCGIDVDQVCDVYVANGNHDQIKEFTPV